MPPAVRMVLSVVPLLLLAGCRVGVSVEVEADRGGGGQVRATVTLDKAAAEQVPDLAEQLRVHDLRAAGWEIVGPSPTPGGGATVRASKPFSSPAGAAKAIKELGGPFQDLRFVGGRSFWKTKTGLAGSLDLTSGLDVFGDEALAERLGGRSLGLDPAEAERELGKPLAEVFTFEVQARLPGTVESNAPATRNGAIVWSTRLGEKLPISATAEAWNLVNVGLVAVSVLAGLALVVVLVRRSRAVSWG